MKINALRVAEVGPFREPVALENLSGGLDVLIGPNELGKSTLFRALATLIGEKHSSVSKSVAALRPNAGGAPLIEADLEIDGRLWRLRKRYLAQRVAELIELRDDGRGQVLRGGEAEEQARILLGGAHGAVNGDALRSFVWVAQGASFALPAKPDPALASSLASLIEQEASDIAGSGAARRMRAAIAEKLGQLVQAKRGQAKAGGPLAAAQQQRAALAAELDDARTKASVAAERLRQLARHQADYAAVTAPGAAVQAEQKIVAARKALADGESARERTRTADERITARQLALDQARTALDRWQHALAELACQQADDATLAGQRADLVAQLAAASGDLVARQQALEANAAAQLENRRVLALSRAASERQAAHLQATQAGAALASARASMQILESLTATLKSSKVSEPQVREIHRQAAALDGLDAQIKSSSPQITVAYFEGAAARIHHDGRPVDGADRIVVERPVELVIEGVGRILIAPGGTQGQDAIAARDAARAALSQGLARIGVADIGGAQVALAARQESERALAEAQARLQALAPAGLAALERALQEATQRTAPAAGIPKEAAALPPLPELLARELSMDEARGLLVQQVAQAQHAASELGEAKARLETRLAAIESRLAVLTAQLPPPQERSIAGERLAAKVEKSTEELGDAVRERASWAAAVPQGADNDALLLRLREAETAARSMDARRSSLERNIAEIEGALRRDGEEGAGAEVAELEERLTQAEARVADIDLEVRGLTMLAERLDAMGSVHREQMLRPLVDRLQGLIAPLFAKARIAIEGPLLVAQLERGGLTEGIEQLSDGTREQIATLVRVAYAGLMSDRGAALPMVFDDALVYSDDQRLRAMLEILAAAAQRHQVVLLSCRQAALEPYLDAAGARRLALQPWRDKDAAAATRTPAIRADSVALARPHSRAAP